MIAEREGIRISQQNERISPEELLWELRRSAVGYCEYDLWHKKRKTFRDIDGTDRVMFSVDRELILIKCSVNIFLLDIYSADFFAKGIYFLSYFFIYFFSREHLYQIFPYINIRIHILIIS